METRKPLNIMIFDTETTWLPESNDIPPSEWERWPRLVQLGYIRWQYLYGRAVPVAIRTRIILPDGFTIPEAAIQVHRITNEKARQHGDPVTDVVKEFASELEKSDIVVAHSLKFDKGVILAECFRNGMAVDVFDHCREICTRESTRDICKIEKDGKIKHPKLAELYRFLFNSDFADAHDAFSDVTALSQCFFALADQLLAE